MKTPDIEKTFDMLLDTAIRNGCSQEDLPQNIIISPTWSLIELVVMVAPMTGLLCYKVNNATPDSDGGIARKWRAGYQMPHLIFWNVDARQNNIPMLGNGPISYVSGFSPSIFQTIMTGKTGYDLMMES